MIKYIFITFAFYIFNFDFTYTFSQEKSKTIIFGSVQDEKSNPLELVNVSIVGTLEGDVTDEHGNFRFATTHTGELTLQARLLGFEPVLKKVTIKSRDSLRIDFVLYETTINLKEIIVSSSAYTTGDQIKGVTLPSLEVVTTPSAAADIFRAVQTFPGVVAVDEGSGLFVRGGDVSETVIMLDQATVYHPYKYETPTGGVFGTIPPFLVSGTFFSAGGFSARYGNTLSGILAMESLDLPKRTMIGMNAGFAAASLSASIPIIPQKFGVRFSGNYSFTDLMFRLNGVGEDFTTTPSGKDANLSFIYKYSETGQIKFFNFANTDRVGVRVNEPSFLGTYNSSETSWLHNVQIKDIVADWFVSGSISHSRFSSEQDFGPILINPSDGASKVRIDGERIFRNKLKVSAGVEIERQSNNFKGRFPKSKSFVHPNAEVYFIDESLTSNRFGIYSECESKIVREFFGSVGLRTDYYSLSKQIVFDPRISLRYQFSNNTNMSFRYGLYHQYPQPMYFNSVSGNPKLDAQLAEHWVTGFEHSTDLLILRLEAYYKQYQKLVLESKIDNYSNNGKGNAKGIDVFLKYGGFLQTPINGWLSYSYLNSKRLQARNIANDYIYEEAPSSFDITHNFTIVAKAQLIHMLSAGITFRYATGRPITPVINALYKPEGNYYEPIFGPVNSERLPDFIRLDGSLSYFLPFGSSNSAIFYLAVANILNRANPVRYEYSDDYSERTLRTSDYRKFFYFGFVINFGIISERI